jgi:hypothetical protein
MAEPSDMINAYVAGANGMPASPIGGTEQAYAAGAATRNLPVTPAPMLPTLPGPYAPGAPYGGSYGGTSGARWVEPAWVPLTLLGLFVAGSQTIMALIAGVVGAILALVLSGSQHVRLGRGFSAAFFSMAAFLAATYGMTRFGVAHGIVAYFPGVIACIAVMIFALRRVFTGVVGYLKSAFVGVAVPLVVPVVCVEILQYATNRPLMPPSVVLKQLASSALAGT